MKLQCPSCGAEVIFKTSTSVMAVCKYCSSTLVRHDMDLENLGKMAQLAPDTSLLQIGTTGVFDGNKFEIIGRQKISWQSGKWNEWYIHFSNGKDAWLAEAQGFYIISFPLNDTNLITAFEKNKSTLKPGQIHKINNIEFKVDDIREVTCNGSEGELPQKSLVGRKATSVDLLGPDKQFANIDFNNEENNIYIGQYTEFSELDLKNLKQEDDGGFSNVEKAGKAKVFNCPSCGGSVKILAEGMTITSVCKFCGSVIDTSNENYKIISKVKEKTKVLLIPIGIKGKLNGTEWQVIGYVEKADGDYKWKEYLLFNVTAGFRWLVEAAGHWNLFKTIKESPKITSSGRRQVAKAFLKTYYLFNKGKAEIKYILGEFYWQARVGDITNADDYISPPEILSCEYDSSEVIWSIGEYIESETVKKAFNLQGPMPVQHGVAPNQPNKKSSKGNFKAFMIFFSIMLCLQIWMVINSKEELAFTGNYIFKQSTKSKEIVTREFDLKYGKTNLSINLYSPVNNNWLEVQGELVNIKTGESMPFEQGVEFYSGSDSDGAWQEGSHSGEKEYSEIPEGKYQLNFQVDSDFNGASDLPYVINVKRDVATYLNFFIYLIILLIYPILSWLVSRSFESKRWSQSDYSPYVSSDSEDDDE